MRAIAAASQARHGLSVSAGSFRKPGAAFASRPAEPHDRVYMITWPNFISQLFNGLALGALLALISSGLTIIYGTLGVLNLAHGAMFMLGGYAGYVAFQATGSFIVAVIAGSLFLVLVGVVMERLIIRHFYSRPHEDQLLVTFGLGICFVEIVRFFFGSLSETVPPPRLLVGDHHARLHVLSDLPAGRGRHRRGGSAWRFIWCSIARGSA